jgi:hypothetical protein
MCLGRGGGEGAEGEQRGGAESESDLLHASSSGWNEVTTSCAASVKQR